MHHLWLISTSCPAGVDVDVIQNSAKQYSVQVQERFRQTAKVSQDAHLASLLKYKEPSRLKDAVVAKNRAYTWIYSIGYDILNIEVCKNYFLHVYEISDKRLRVIKQKKWTELSNSKRTEVLQHAVEPFLKKCGT